MEKILVMNPGSTSTKIAVYQDETPLFVESIEHSQDSGGVVAVGSGLLRVQIAPAHVVESHAGFPVSGAIRDNASFRSTEILIQ